MSQFDALFKTDAAPKKETKPKSNQPKKKSITAVPSSTASAPPPVSDPPKVAKAEKRPSGKSKSPDYTQVLTYVRRDTHNAVKAALIFDTERRDLSDLVEELLKDWLKKQKK